MSARGQQPRIVLASQSPARRATLQAAGVNPLIRVSGVDEEEIVAALRAGSISEPSPSQIVCAQAKAKALEVAQSVATELNTGRFHEVSPEATSILLVVGCDSMLEIGGRMVGKPGTPEVAVRRIKEMRGKDAVLWTGHALVPVVREPGVDVGAQDQWTMNPSITQDASTIVHFGSMSDEEIDAYVATGEPLGVAGSFTIDGLGGPFVEAVTGDPHSVVGISLPLLRRMVSESGVFWPDLWNTDIQADER